MAVNLISRRIKNYFFQQFRNGYIVLLPEVNTESAEKNPLFKNGLPDFDKLSREKCVNAFGKIILDFEHSVRGIEDDLLSRKYETEDSKEPLDVFDDVIDHMENTSTAFDTTWGLLKTLCYIDQDLLPPETYLPLNDRARMALRLKYNSHHFYSAVKNCDISKLTEEEQRVLGKFLVEGKLNGLELSGDKKLIFTEISRKIAKHMHDFKTKNDLSKGLFKHMISDVTIMQDFPRQVLQSIAVDGGWIMSLKPNIYPMLLERCPDRSLRLNAWLAYNHCSTSHPELNNSTSLENIRCARKDLAKLLGYNNYAEMSMETKMAGSVDNIWSTIQAILEKAHPKQEEELLELYDFAKSCGYGGRLEEYDIPFWAHLHRRQVYDWDENKTSEYFPLDQVLTGLFEMTEKMLGIKINKVDSVDTPNPHVSYYQIIENSNMVAGFYLDPYFRENKAVGCASICMRPSSKFHEHHPLTYLTCDFASPSDKKPSLLTLAQVEQLFTKFGTALQQVMSTVNYSEVSGLSFIEWDAVEVVRNIFSLCLNEEAVLSKISGHYKTGDKLDPVKIKAIRNHMAGYNTCKEIYLSLVDLQIHSSDKFWLTIAKDEWARCMVSDYNDNDHSVCSFSESIIGPLSAAYYSKIWSKMLAHDVYRNTLADVTSKDDQQLSDIGSRLRDTFFAFGGSCHPSEVFRRFQGRDPTPEAFINSFNTQTSSNTK